MGIPSENITPEAEFALAHETQLNRFQSGNYWNSFTCATYGIGKNTELASSAYGFSIPGSGNRALGFGLKSMIPIEKKWQFKLTGGFMIPVSFNNKGTAYWVYGNASIRVPQSRTRITVGRSFGTRQIFGRRAYSTMVGVEQPLTKRWGIVSDWFSGTNDLGAAIAGRQGTSLGGFSLGGGNFFSVGPQLQLPIFNSGRIKSNIALNDARVEQEKLAYRNEILTAFEEAANAIAAMERQKEREAKLAAASALAQTSLELSSDL